MNDPDRKIEMLAQRARRAAAAPREEMPPGFATRVFAAVRAERASSALGQVSGWSLAAACVVLLACWLAPLGKVDEQRLAALMVQTEMPK